MIPLFEQSGSGRAQAYLVAFLIGLVFAATGFLFVAPTELPHRLFIGFGSGATRLLVFGTVGALFICGGYFLARLHRSLQLDHLFQLRRLPPHEAYEFVHSILAKRRLESSKDADLRWPVYSGKVKAFNEALRDGLPTMTEAWEAILRAGLGVLVQQHDCLGASIDIEHPMHVTRVELFRPSADPDPSDEPHWLRSRDRRGLVADCSRLAWELRIDGEEEFVFALLVRGELEPIVVRVDRSGEATMSGSGIPV